MNKIGKYSGNRRIDTSSFDEPDPDDEKTFQRWLGGEREVTAKRFLRICKTNISHTTDPNNIVIHMVGKSHIDCAWMWRFEQTRKKAQITFKKAILHSRLFPNTFCFALSQPILLEWIKADDPSLFNEIKQMVKNGNIELVGGSYVEPDCMMPSGESFIRQRLYGMHFLLKNFNVLPSVEWFLDSFGYNRGLPQILAKTGAKFIWTNKMTWNRDTIFPFVNFWWQSPNGNRILAANFWENESVFGDWDRFQIGRHLLKREGRKIWDYNLDYSTLKEHVDEKICPVVGFFFGIGDGGHGPTHKEVALANAMAKEKIFRWSRVESFFNEINTYSDRFPIWNDELYLETHRGCFSNHALVKRQNRKYENLLNSLEMAALLIKLTNSNYIYPMEEFQNLWKTVLKNQFHDVLPGSSIPEVYDEVYDDWELQNAKIKSIYKEFSSKLAIEKKYSNLNKTVNLVLFNPHTWETDYRLFIPIYIFNKIPELDDNGRPLYAELEISNKIYICQPISADPIETIDSRQAGWWTIINLNPISLTRAKITILDKKKSEKIQKNYKIEVSDTRIANDQIKLKIDPKTGTFIELNAKNVNNERNLFKGHSSNLTYGFLDDDKKDPAWNLTPEYWKYPKNYEHDKDVKIRICESGPIFGTLEISKTIGISNVVQKIRIFTNRKEIFIDYITDWKEEHVMLKVSYNTSTNAEIVVADATYCAGSSKTKPEVPCDIARFEKICHEYCDLSTPDNTWGFAILNEGKYAYDANGGDLRLTMLRSCLYPPPSPEAWVNQERKENEQNYGHSVPKFSGLGPMMCRYALLPHKGGALINEDGSPNSIVKRKAKEFNMPILVFPINDHQVNDTTTLLNGKSFAKVLNPNVFLGALKFSEWKKDGTIIIRFYEISGFKTEASIQFNEQFSERILKIEPADLIEREIQDKCNWNSNNCKLTFELNSFEIKTFKIYIK
ncbi:MAG: alpha-mannosidase [Candidatus Hodarchaeota archaeon]